ncbi:unnamed protein product [Amoebophrya sp. A25]|nr:unnamed protein product [Amoebophrya sp. A25]|eukprot:GSA25T00002012001.1
MSPKGAASSSSRTSAKRVSGLFSNARLAGLKLLDKSFREHQDEARAQLLRAGDEQDNDDEHVDARRLPSPVVKRVRFESPTSKRMSTPLPLLPDSPDDVRWYSYYDGDCLGRALFDKPEDEDDEEDYYEGRRRLPIGPSCNSDSYSERDFPINSEKSGGGASRGKRRRPEFRKRSDRDSAMRLAYWPWMRQERHFDEGGNEVFTEVCTCPWPVLAAEIRATLFSEWRSCSLDFMSATERDSVWLKRIRNEKNHNEKTGGRGKQISGTTQTDEEVQALQEIVPGALDPRCSLLQQFRFLAKGKFRTTLLSRNAESLHLLQKKNKRLGKTASNNNPFAPGSRVDESASIREAYLSPSRVTVLAHDNTGVEAHSKSSLSSASQKQNLSNRHHLVGKKYRVLVAPQTLVWRRVFERWFRARRHAAAIRLLERWHALQVWRLYLLPAIFAVREQRIHAGRVVRTVVAAPRLRRHAYRLKRIALAAWCGASIADRERADRFYLRKLQRRRVFALLRDFCIDSRRQKLAVAKFYREVVCQRGFMRPALLVWKYVFTDVQRTRRFVRGWHWWCVTGKYRVWRRNFHTRQTFLKAWFSIAESRCKVERGLTKCLSLRKRFLHWYYAYHACRKMREHEERNAMTRIQLLREEKEQLARMEAMLKKEGNTALVHIGSTMLEAIKRKRLGGMGHSTKSQEEKAYAALANDPDASSRSGFTADFQASAALPPPLSVGWTW